MKVGKLAIFFGGVLVVGIAIGGKGLTLGENINTPRLSQGVMPTIGPIRDVITAKGIVAYSHQFVLRSNITGQVADLVVNEGDEVAFDQHLLRVVAPLEKVDFDLHKIKMQREQENLNAIDKDITAIQRLVQVGGMSQYELDQKYLERDLANKALQQVQLEISRLNQEKELSNLVSPAKGLVLSIPIKEGQRVTTGDELISLSGGDGPYIVTFIDAIDVQRVHIDQPVVFSDQEDSGMRRKARVKDISDTVANAQRPNSVKVLIEPIESIQDLRISQQLYVEFVILEEASVLRVPLELVYNEGGNEVVYVLSNQEIVTRLIATQPGDISFAKVISGISVTDQLVPRP